MLRMIVRLCMMTCWCLLVATGAMAEEGPKPLTPLANGCGYLNVYINSPTGPAAVSNSGVACDHGYLSSIQPNQTDTKQVTLQQSSVYGPDCSITISVQNSTYVIRTQQNYCGLEAGNINAYVVSGNAQITGIQTGSFAQGRPGQVWVTVR